MSTRIICCLVLVVAIFNDCRALPAAAENQRHRRAPQEGDDGPLPFIQFTKGGIRVNFGGYHAQAGLGGLLTGRAADGGLHASAGIENGPSASAGLGGSLENGPQGGLHARAGLGGSGPAAEAGLSGSLAGPKPTGDIYSRAQIANGIEVSKTKGKNVQIIPRPKKATEQDQYAASGATAAALNRDPSDSDNEALKKSHPARWYFEKRVQERIAAAGQTTAEPTTTDSNAISEQAVTSSSAGSSSSSSSSSSTNINNSSSNSIKEKNSGGRQTSGIYSRATASASNDEAIQDTGRPKHRSTLFDDIFNIPISALNAVNKLLKNHVGKK
ncbi:hypothetical protein TKK_0002799 [Trichogramma kaykai]|uniref:Uncharacterized protein n=1 Tax=Trichogramma kaykai TaxID=54128 RepID=A0ABD2XUI0_9HYME